jgi:hypothetical protein
VSLASWLLVAHLLVFGIWLGTDLATFHLSRKVTDTSLAIPTRTTLAGSMMGVEVMARLSLPTMLGLGLALSIETGWWDEPRGLVPVVLLAALAWAGLVWAIHVAGDAAATARLVAVDLVVRVAVCAVLWVVGLWSAFGDGPFAAHWLGAKVALFALIMTSGIAIRVVLRPFGPAFAELVHAGGGAGQEATMTASVARARPFVVVIWGSLVGSVILAVARTVPWS